MLHTTDGIWKVHFNDSQDSLIDALHGVLTQVVEPGALHKHASSAVVGKDVLAQFTPPKGFFLAHTISHGDGEWYGFNKNGDFWPEEWNKKNKDTFVKYGAYYSEHQVKPENRKGIIKAAFHNPDMHWTEIVFWGDRKKAEADYEDAKAGKPRTYSISALAEKDICSACGSTHRKRSEYCKHASEMLTTFDPESKKFVYLVNYNPTFYDLSDVARPADRVAHTLEYIMPGASGLKKAASATPARLSADIAEEIGIPQTHAVGIRHAGIVPLLSRICDLAKHASIATSGGGIILDDTDINRFREMRPRSMFSRLAGAGAVLPFHEFGAYVTGEPLLKLAGDKNFRAAYNGMAQDFWGSLATVPGGDHIVDNFITNTVDNPDPRYSSDDDKLIKKVASLSGVTLFLSGDPARLIKRAVEEIPLNVVEEIPESDCMSSEKANALASIYGLYKLAALYEMGNYSTIKTVDPQVLLTIMGVK